MADLTLPSEISPDGREVWDWADRLSDAVQRAEAIKTLTVQIRNAETQCGSCADWMTPACPREVRGKFGRSTGPSSLAIKCSAFRMTAQSAGDLEAARAKLAALSNPPRSQQ